MSQKTQLYKLHHIRFDSFNSLTTPSIVDEYETFTFGSEPITKLTSSNVDIKCRSIFDFPLLGFSGIQVYNDIPTLECSSKFTLAESIVPPINDNTLGISIELHKPKLCLLILQ